MNSLEFLKTLYAEADADKSGHTQLFCLPSATAVPINITDITIPTLPPESSSEDVYFSPGISAEPHSQKLAADDVIGIPGLWVDIDIANPGAHKKNNLPADVAQAMSIIPDDLPPSIVVFSGFGIHAYWIFRECWYFDTPEEKTAASDLLTRLQAYLRHRAAENGWHLDSTTNLDRVMRLPGTQNYKIKSAPTFCQVIESCDDRYNPSDIADMIPEIDPVTGQRIRRSSFERRPTDGPAAPMLSNCNFLTHAQLNAKTLSYGEWLAALTNLVRATDGVDVAHQISALDVDRYNADKTDRKIDECLSAMHPQTCAYIQRDLGFAGCPAGGCGVQAPCGWSLAKIPQAIATVRAISVPTPETAYSPEVIGALALIQKENPVEFDIFLQKCRGQLNQNTLKSEIKKHRIASSGLVVVEGGGDDPDSSSDDEDKTVFGKFLFDTVPDAPLNLRMPRGGSNNTELWSFGDKGVKLQRVSNQGAVIHSRASHVPILITERIFNVDSQMEKARVAFKTRHGWRSLILPKTTIFSSRNIMCLANSGLTMNEDNARYLAKWLSALEAANADKIPERNGVGKLGWRTNDTEFVLPGLASSYTIDSGSESEGILSSIGSAGDHAAWIGAMMHLRSKFRARFILAASFAAPLLKIVGQRTFMIHNWGTTADGKTATLQAALSVWGKPDDVMLTFNNTATSLEKMAEFYTDLPLGINEYEVINDRRRADSADNMVYMLSEGKGKGRANKDGTRQRSASWRTVAITNGESPITRASSKGGIITRVIELHGGPLKNDEVFASNLYRTLSRNYGHAGPEFITRLLAEDHDLLADQYNSTRMALRSVHPGSLEAHVDAIACVVLADYLSSQWIFGATESDAGQQSIQMGESILAELVGKSDASESERGWDWLQDWIAAGKHRFEAARTDYTSGEREYSSRVVGQVNGYIDDEGTHIIKTVLSDALREAGFSPEKLYRQWAEENRIQFTARGDGRRDYGTKIRRFNGVAPWVISVKT